MARPESAPRILVIEDDASLRTLLARLLREAGYVTSIAGDLEGGLREAREREPALVLLDRRLPDRDGLTAVDELRRLGGGCPVLMLTARDAVHDRVAGLEGGADDYILKPFDGEELLARIRAHLRRANRGGEVVPQVGDLVLDPLHRTATRGGTTIALTQREFSLLAVLMRRAGEPLTREQLAAEAWRQELDGAPATNVVDVYVAYLRRKLDAGDLPPLLHTVRGLGYVLQADSAEGAEAVR